jgi:hypothetical protein
MRDEFTTSETSQQHGTDARTRATHETVRATSANGVRTARHHMRNSTRDRREN